MCTWRRLRLSDLKDVMRVASDVHPGLPERECVFAERIQLFPEGCLALVNSAEICGYAISHPIRHNQPPALNSILGEIAPDADSYYIHDLAILDKFRGAGYASACIAKLLVVAECYPATYLVSVYGTGPFWRRFGFASVSRDSTLSEKLRQYGDDATYLRRQNRLE
ncbi:hypothetical protein JX266_010900 [Neoarthrinium moseri]|nr:hypothetical protein JX266_010900 [Neoarthrinium moseri]